MMEEMSHNVTLQQPKTNDFVSSFEADSNDEYSERMKAHELEQEQLSESLRALTTHFAQVQFRLRQIVQAPSDVKENLLKELEEFASRGCPNLSTSNSINFDFTNSSFHETILEEQRKKQRDLIEQLKNQLQDLESYAYQSGDLDLPSSVVLEKQQFIINELKDKIHLPIDNLKNLTNEDLKKLVEQAIGQILNPVKTKEQLVNQLKTQIADLERFISFLQGEVSSPGPLGTKCKCEQKTFSYTHNQNILSAASTEASLGAKNNNEKTLNVLKKMLSMLQIFALTQLTCGGTSTFEKNNLKKSDHHWGDLRASLEIAIQKTHVVSMKLEQYKIINSESDFEDVDVNNNDTMIEKPFFRELIQCVYRDLTNSLRDLLQHGLIETNYNRSLVPAFAVCLPTRGTKLDNHLHAWDLFQKYYESKHGREFAESPANKLSQSFGLNSIGGRKLTIKHSLLSAIQTCINLHKNTKNKDFQLKSFVCLALNEKKLVLYLKQILKTQLIIENFYQSWSYVKSTGFDDALKSLDQLKSFKFNIPIDHMIRYSNTKLVKNLI